MRSHMKTNGELEYPATCEIKRRGSFFPHHEAFSFA
jgi:hypothetical protein